ncbi:hypothetical protein SLEP1_g9054 [Rubroshorea leprosula]|uniref:Uncharacterized protein n=1 Tax=Rubroshorea leprosula TaxID=152421 RepID=A0AAV5IC36_9ROSI|nr:hypothetical protein SLEP1_g9054 [Rubroshorea leprosula]
MRFFKRIAGLLGLVRDDGHQVNQQEDKEENNASTASNNSHNQQANEPRVFHETGLPRRGFSVPVQVAVDRPQLGPVLVSCTPGGGGVQGLRWYAKRLRIDEDGDVADEFLNEVLLETSISAEDDQRSFPKFQIKYSTIPAKVKNQVVSLGGKIQQHVEFQGRLQWV